MFLTSPIHWLFLTVLTVFAADEIMEQRTKSYTVKNGELVCKELIQDPYFDAKFVVGKPWKIYYTWNIRFYDICMELVFRYTNPQAHNTMLAFQKFGIKSKKPVLHVSMGALQGLMLIENRNNDTGLFRAVPYFMDNNSTERYAVEIFKVAFKLLKGGRYLVMSDCKHGTTSLSILKKNKPNLKKIAAFASQFNFGYPYPACIKNDDPLSRQDHQFNGIKF